MIMYKDDLMMILSGSYYKLTLQYKCKYEEIIMVMRAYHHIMNDIIFYQIMHV